MGGVGRGKAKGEREKVRGVKGKRERGRVGRGKTGEYSARGNINNREDGKER